MHQSFEKNLITTKDAGELSGYSSDYLSRLVRSGKISGKRIGHSWLVDKASLERFLNVQGNNKIERARQLANARAEEYRAHRSLLHRTTNALTKSVYASKKVPAQSTDSGLVAHSFASHVPALATALLVVLSGALGAQAAVIPQFAENAMALINETATGFDAAFGGIPAHIVANVHKADDTMRATVAKVTTANQIASAQIASRALSEPDLSSLRMTFDDSHETLRFASAPETLVPVSLSPTFTFADVQTFVHDTTSLFTSPSRLVRAYVDMGEQAYAGIGAVFTAYDSLVRMAGADTLTIAASTRDTLATLPSFVSSMNFALGESVIALAHSAIRADVAAAYWTAAAAPAVSRATVARIGTLGDALARGAERVPALATTAYLRAVSAPAVLAPAIARSVFDAEYAGAVRFVAATNALSSRYLTLINNTGNVAYGAVSHLRGMSDMYLDVLGKSAVAVGSAKDASLAAALVAVRQLSLGEQTALTTYEAIHGIFSSAGDALATFFTTTPEIILPTGVPKSHVIAGATSTAPSATVSRAPAPSYPSYTTVVQGISGDLLNQSLASLRTEMLNAIATQIRPVAAQTATNIQTIQMVNKIEKLNGLAVTNGIFTGGSFTGGYAVSATNGNFDTFSAGTTTLANTTVSGNLTVSGSQTITGTTAYTNLATFSNGFLSLASSTITSGLFSMNGGASTTNFTNSGSTWLTNLSGSSLLATDANSKIIATTSIGVSNLALVKGNFLVGNDSGVAQATSSIFISSTGNVGIGTASPTYALDVTGFGHVTGLVDADHFVATSTTATSTFAGFIDVLGTGANATSTFASNLWVKGTLRTGMGSMYLNDTSLTSSDGNIALTRNGMSWFNGGNVGIGTTSPDALLALQQITNGTPFISAYRATDAAPSGDFINYKTKAGTTLFRVDNSGNLLAGGIINTGSQTITSTSQPQFRVQYDGSNEVTFSTSGTGATSLSINGTTPSLSFVPQSNAVNQFNITDAASNSVLSIDTINRRIGIGTTSPFASLSLAGSAGGATNLFAISTSTAGFATTTALTVDANGNLALNNGANLTVGGNLSVSGTTAYTNLATFSNGFLSLASSTITSGLFSMNGGASTTQLTTTGSTYLATLGGNVGIGTTSPYANLSITGSGNTEPLFVVASSTGASQLSLGVNGVLTLTPSGTDRNGGMILNFNSATPPLIPHADSFRIVAADNTVGAIYMNTWGARNIMNAYMARGTADAPSATWSGDELFRIAGRGYASTVYTGSTAAVSLFAGEQYTDTAQGGWVGFRTTPLGSTGGGSETTPPVVSAITPSGGLLVGSQYFTASSSNQVMLGAEPGDGGIFASSLALGTTTSGQKLVVSGGNILLDDSQYLLWGGTKNGITGSNASNFINFATNNAERMRIDTSGNVGIGTTGPTYKLDVAGLGHFTGLVDAPNFVATSTTATSTFAGGLTVGTSKLVVDSTTGNVSIGTTNPTALFYINAGDTATPTYTNAGGGTLSTSYVTGALSSTTVTTALGATYGNFDYLQVNPSSPIDKLFVGRALTATIPFGNSAAITSALWGYRPVVSNFGSGLTGNLSAFVGTVLNYGAGSTVANVIGAQILAGNGNNSSQYSTTTNVYGGNFTIQNGSVNGLISNRYGAYVGASNSGTVTNDYGFYATGLATGGIHTNTPYDFYGADSGAYNYFAGNVGIASTSPWGLLSVNPNGVTGPAFVVGSSTATNFIVTNGGNVGIGTASPSGTLEVAGSSAGGLVQTVFTNTNTAASSYSALSFVTGDDGTVGRTRARVTVGSDAANNGFFSILTRTSGTLTEYMRVTGTGNVGIGTTSPTAALDVKAASSAAQALRLTGNIANTDNTQLVLAGLKDGNLWSIGTDVDNTTQGKLQIYNWGNAGGTAGVALTMLGSGNVGIGTTTPWAQLSVNPNGITGPAFVVGSSTATNFIVTNGGNVGIGTTNPGASLDVQNALDSSQVRIGTNTGYYYDIGRQTSAGNTVGYLKLKGNQAGYSGYYFTDSDETMKVVFKNGGNVGIGTTTPGEKLEIAGTAGSNLMLKLNAVADKYAQLGYYEAGTLKWNIYNDYSNDNLAFGNSGGAKVSIQQDGNVGIGTTSPVFDANGASGGTYLTLQSASTLSEIGVSLNQTGVNGYIGGYAFVNAGLSATEKRNAVIFGANDGANNSGNMQFWTSNAGTLAEAMRITSGGTVGIGTTTPAASLDIYNTGNANQLNVTSTGSNAGINLINNGSGGQEWQLLSSISSGQVGNFRIDNGSSGTKFVIDASGNVGIGTTSPNVLGWSAGNTVLTVSSNPTTANQRGVLELVDSNLTANSGSIASIDMIGNMNRLVRLYSVADGAVDSGYFAIATTPTGGSNTERFRITSAGNVGIGTTAPFSKLDVRGSGGTISSLNTAAQTLITGSQSMAASGGYLIGSGAAGTDIVPLLVASENAAGQNIGGSIGFGGKYAAASNAAVTFAGIIGAKENATDANASGYLAFGTRLTGSYIAERMRIDSTGNVGIGTTGPGAKLNIYDASAANARLLVGASNTWTNSYTGYQAGIGAVQVISSGTAGGQFIGGIGAVAINTGVAQLVGLTTTTAGAEKRAGSVSIDLDADSTTAVNGRISFNTSSAGTLTERMRIDSAGNVGIGTTSPVGRLAVQVNDFLSALVPLVVNKTGGGGNTNTIAMTISNDYLGSAGYRKGLVVTAQNLQGSANIGPVTAIEANAYSSRTGGRSASSQYAGNFNFTTAGGASTAAGLTYYGVSSVVNNTFTGESSTVYGMYSSAIGPSTVYGLYASGSGGTTNYGVYSAAGTNYFAGNVGIGTTTPNNKLDIYDTSKAAIGFSGASGSTYKWTMGEDMADTGKFKISSSTALGTNDRFVIDGKGNIGIGTASPATRLDVEGAQDTDLVYIFSTTGTHGLALGSRTTGGPYAIISSNHAEPIVFGINGVEKMRLDANGNLGIGTTTPISALTLTANAASGTIQPVLSFTGTFGDTASGRSIDFYIGNQTYRTARIVNITNPGVGQYGSLAFYTTANYGTTDASEKMRIDGAGNVGIGTTSPSYLLSVGNSSVSGTVAQFENSTGSCYVNPNNAFTGCTSDARLKNVIAHLPSTLAEIGTLDPVTYSWKSDNLDTPHTGFLAQDVQKIFPDLVMEGADGYLALNYAGLVPYLVKGVQELNARTSFVNSAATSTVLTVDATGRIGIGTTTPQRALDVAGEVGAIAFVNTSTRDAKDDISYIATSTAASMLNQLVNLKIANYRYKIENQNDPLRLGLIAEDTQSVAPEVLSADGKGVDIYKLATFTLAGAQALAEKISGQEVHLASIEERVAALEAGAAGSATSSPALFSSSTLASALEGFGVLLQKGVAQFNTLVFHQFVASADSHGTASASSVTILAGNTIAQVDNTLVLPTTKIFVTFNSQIVGSWWVSDKTTGSFRVMLSAPQPAEVSFDYFLVQTEGQIATSTSDSSLSPAPDSSPSNGPDIVPPVITLLGDNPVRLSVGGTFTDPGITVADNVDGIDPYTVFINGIQQTASSTAIDTASPTTYIITYQATDRAGNMSTVMRSVIVGDSSGSGSEIGSGSLTAQSASTTPADTTPPIVTLLDSAAIEITAGSSFTDPGATASDETDGDLSEKIAVSGTVDTTTIGLYTLTYKATDAAGNTGSVSRVVSVVAPSTTL
ncbi:MAG: DUF5011 domain-containing protein [Candidatus Pacebacteria bacterium]|nr:DUF5011 domain-containing protein [Candidatus Paceibacterota bacterium]